MLLQDLEVECCWVENVGSWEVGKLEVGQLGSWDVGEFGIWAVRTLGSWEVGKLESVTCVWESDGV